MTTKSTSTPASPAGLDPRQVCLRCEPNLAGVPIWGELADIPGIGLVGRARLDGATHYVRIDPDNVDLGRVPNDRFAASTRIDNPRHGLGWNLLHGAVTIDGGREIRRMLDERGGLGMFHPVHPEQLLSEEQREARKFAREYPTFAPRLVAAGAIPAVADPGYRVPFTVAYIPKGRTNDRYHVIPWTDCLERHLNGNYGEYGAFSPEPLSEPEVFALGLISTGRVNDHAVQTGDGLVVSRFPIDHPELPRGPWGLRRAHFVTVATELTPRGSTTVLAYSSEDVPG